MISVIFDIGRVLVPEGQRVPMLLAVLADAGFQISEQDFNEAYWGLRDEYDLGLADEKYWGSVLSQLGLTKEQQSQVSYHELASVDGNRNAVLGAESAELVQWLASLDVPLALLSNAPESMVKAVRASQWSHYFKAAVFSSEVGVAKPDPEIYRIAHAKVTERIGEIPAEDIIFFDDREKNICAAVDAGWDAYLWEGADRARAVINNRLNEL
ncbi:HAD-IA family hydrolase [Corynebacterium amycolatum]|uniref:HAD-IA family hydrolase n=1 Tax=Corynebacterium amycolatum TaxID=43765 RepID=UPI00396B4082